MPSGSGRYARGYNALAICERCSQKSLRRKLVYDGQFPDLLVCTSCWDPKHPQEYLPAVTDPVTIYDPTGDPDKFQANTQVVSFPVLGQLPMALQIGISLNQTRYTVLSGGVVDA
jgi:hypothetical protein